MMPKAMLGSMPLLISQFMMSSRVEMVSSVGVPALIRSWALFSHTSVPWEYPEIRSRSEKFLGFTSEIICRTNRVPHSGTP